MSVKTKKLEKEGRNYGIYNDTIREILYLVGQSRQSLLIGQIANHIRKDEQIKMSNEYKIIKRLCPSPSSLSGINNPRTHRFLDIVKREDGKDGYVLNFRGLLLYLFNEFLIMKDDSKNYEEKTERERSQLRNQIVNKNPRFNLRIVKRIKCVLSNPKTINIAPFLTDWQHFEKNGFDVIGLLLKISVELQNQIHIDAYEDTYLLRRATERYIIPLENLYDGNILLVTIKNGMKLEEFQSLKEIMNSYRKLIVSLNKRYVKIELDRLNYIEKLTAEFDMLNDLDKLIVTRKNIISVKTLMSKYKKYFENTVTIIDILKNKGNYSNYVFSDYFLISKDLLEMMNHSLIESMKFPELVSVFGKYDIPNSCISEVMDYLGYELKANRVNEEDDLETGRNITFIKKDIRYIESSKKNY